MRTACDSAFVRPGSTPGIGSHALVAESRAGPRCQCPRGWSRFESGRAHSAAAHGCGPAPVKRAVRLDTERRLAIRGRLRARRTALDGENAGSIPAPGTHACLVATVSMPPWYGGGRGSIPRAGSMQTRRRRKRDAFPRRRWRVRAPSSAPCDRSVSGKHLTSPRLGGRFESGRSLGPQSRAYALVVKR
jgi:hypothetical protein